MQVLQDLRILEHADLDAEVVVRGVERVEVQVAAVVGQHRHPAVLGIEQHEIIVGGSEALDPDDHRHPEAP